jgi:hypothetical protein
VRLTDEHRRRLAVRAKALGEPRDALAEALVRARAGSHISSRVFPRVSRTHCRTKMNDRTAKAQ